MILFENVIIAFVFALLLFLIFNFVNVYSFCKDVITAAFLSINLLYLWVVMPFKGVSEIHKKRRHVMSAIKKDPKISIEDREIMREILDKKVKIFFMLYRSGAFSYNDLVLTFARWYLDKPFKIRLTIPSKKEIQKEYAKGYVSLLQKELKEAVYT